MNIVTTTEWLKLSPDIRLALRVGLKIPMTGCVEVEDSARIISDGVTGYDLLQITADKMAEYVGGDFPDAHPSDRFDMLWCKSLAKAAGMIESTSDVQPPKESFCDSCDSKGVRHKKDCVNNPNKINPVE